MESIITKSFKINLNILTMFGLYPPEKTTHVYRIRSYLFYFLFTYPIPVLGMLYFILEEEIDPLRLGDNAFLVAETACQITKLLPFIINGNRLKKCIHYLENPIFATKKNQHTEILDNCVTTCQRNSNVFVISVIGGLISWALRPLLGNERRFPVDVWVPFNITAATKSYVSTFMLLVMGVGYVSIASAAIDPLIGGLACLAAGQLQILKDNLRTLHTTRDYKTTKKFRRNRSVKDKIKKCVQHHDAVLLFIKEYEQCFSSSVFSQFVGSVLVICFCCLQLSKISPMTFNFISMVGYLSILLAQIYFYCYYGTILYEESNTLTNAIYMGTWYDYDVKSRKDLILIMERSKRPIVVTAGKILDLSVITFTSILRKSYSLLAVLKNQ